MINVGNKYVLHSENGMDYEIEVVSVNYCREPSMRYAIDVVDGNGVSPGDYLFVGDDFFKNPRIEAVA